MQNARLNLLSLTHVPEIFAQISARAAGDVHLALVLVVADGALPLIVVVNYNFAVETAYMAVVGFGIEFCVLDIVVNKLNHVFQRL